MIFVINSIEYEVEPDITHKVSDGRFYYSPPKGFGGAEFKIKPNEGKQVVTHNLWEIGPTEKPDNAVFVGKAPQKPKLKSYDWSYR